jgi:hypothetical protein
VTTAPLPVHRLNGDGRARVVPRPALRVVKPPSEVDLVAAGVVELFARRPQVQERLTQQVADWLQDHVAPRGVGVVVEAEHLCMTMRGVGAFGATTVTSALHGQLRSDATSRGEFFTLISANQERGGAPCLTR